MRWILIACTLLVSSACTKKQDGAEVSSPQAQAVAVGERIYKAQCIQCHSPNPAQPGPVGPEVAGSSKELIEARIMKAEYPPGYTPKRNTKAMPAMPFLKNDIESLTSYLQSVGK